MSAQERETLDGLAASSRLLNMYLEEADKPQALPDGKATLRCLVELGDMLNDLAALVVAQPERDPFRLAEEQIVMAAHQLVGARTIVEREVAEALLTACVAAHNQLADRIARERS